MEKLRFRKVLEIKIEEESIETKEETIEKREEQIESREPVLPLYDIFLENFQFAEEEISLNTEIEASIEKEVLEEERYVEDVLKHLDIKLVPYEIELQPLDTNIYEVPQINEKELISLIDIFDLKLASAILEEQTQILNTEVKEDIELITEIEENMLDLKLVKPILEEENIVNINTEVVISTEFEKSLESIASEIILDQSLIFEELIESDGVFPRGFSESQNSPIVVLIGEEDEPEWHSPIIYSLKELFLEINEKHPRITFRRSEIYEEGIEEIIDSTEPHSLEQFGFESKIEFLDARKFHYSFEDFVKIVEGRLKSGFLQQFGILVIALRRSNIEKAKEVLEKFKGLKIYTCFSEEAKREKRFLKYLPKDLDEKERYKLFCSKVLGVEGHDDFFRKLEVYRNRLESTYKRFSVFVKRDIKEDEKGKDPHQYPLKVATFVYLLNDLKNRNKVRIKNLEELYDFIKQALKNKNISIEEEVKVNPQNFDKKSIIPDLIYKPDNNEIYIEIETLIGTIEPLKKIDETVEKYEGITSANIWIVLKPISALLHYEGLKHRERVYKKLYEDKKIEFKVLTLSSKDKWGLIDIDDFVKSYGK